MRPGRKPKLLALSRTGSFDNICICIVLCISLVSSETDLLFFRSVFEKENCFLLYLLEIHLSVSELGSSILPEVIKLFSCSTQLSIKFELLINDKLTQIN